MGGSWQPASSHDVAMTPRALTGLCCPVPPSSCGAGTLAGWAQTLPIQEPPRPCGHRLPKTLPWTRSAGAVGEGDASVGSRLCRAGTPSRRLWRPVLPSAARHSSQGTRGNSARLCAGGGGGGRASLLSSSRHSSRPPTRTAVSCPLTAQPRRGAQHQWVTAVSSQPHVLTCPPPGPPSPAALPHFPQSAQGVQPHTCSSSAREQAPEAAALPASLVCSGSGTQ